MASIFDKKFCECENILMASETETKRPYVINSQYRGPRNTQNEHGNSQAEQRLRELVRKDPGQGRFRMKVRELFHGVVGLFGGGTSGASETDNGNLLYDPRKITK